jgi:antitoxin ParD1/3/4
MGSRQVRTLSLTPEQTRFVDRCVESGRYQSASEVVRASLRLLIAQDELHAASLQAVKKMIQAGVEQLDRGEVVDGEKVFRRLQARRDRMRRQASGR